MAEDAPDRIVSDEDGREPVFGEHMRISRTILNEKIPDGESLERAWLTVKRQTAHGDGDAVIQLTITDTETGEGHITEAGTGGSANAELYFRIFGLHYNNIVAGRTYFYDVAVRTGDGSVGNPEVGKIRWRPHVTHDT